MAQGISVHNIGGISNFAYYGPHHQILAFDTGPGNIWIDAATEEATQGRQKYDKNGRLAKQGTPDFAAIKRMLKSDRYYRTKPPKSTGRDQLPYSLFKKSTTAREESLVATATQMTVESIALSYEKWILQNKLPLAKIYLCGGGSQNGTLLQWLQKRLAPISIETLDEIGGSSQFAESQAFAFLGYLTLIGQPLGGLWTGAQKFGPPGHLVPGKNWIKLMRQLKSFEL